MFAIAWLTGCVLTSQTESPEPEPGRLLLTWTVGARGCADAGVTEVEIEMGAARERIACEEGGATITGDPGRYDVVATGFDAGGRPRYEGTTTVTVPEGAEATAHVTLSALPASLEVTWYFENGRLCAANGATDVHLVLFDEDDYVVDETTLPCDDGIASLAELESGEYGLLAEALDDAGALVFEGSLPVTLEKGDALSVEVELLAPAE
jgi:hypothetical protein